MVPELKLLVPTVYEDQARYMIFLSSKIYPQGQLRGTVWLVEVW